MGKQKLPERRLAAARLGRERTGGESNGGAGIGENNAGAARARRGDGRVKGFVGFAEGNRFTFGAKFGSKRVRVPILRHRHNGLVADKGWMSK